jgi:hypothetical protein
MTKISSGSMFIMKRVFPVLWFGFLVFFVGASMMSAITRGPELSDLFFLVVPAFMAIIGYTVMKQFIWDLVDEVYDHGDYLVIRNRGDEARIELADIMNVSVSTNMNPPRITLRLIHPTRVRNGGLLLSNSPLHVESFCQE